MTSDLYCNIVKLVSMTRKKTQAHFADQPETQNTYSNTTPKGNKSKEASNHLTGEEGEVGTVPSSKNIIY